MGKPVALTAPRFGRKNVIHPRLKGKPALWLRQGLRGAWGHRSIRQRRSCTGPQISISPLTRTARGDHPSEHGEREGEAQLLHLFICTPLVPVHWVVWQQGKLM